VEDTRAFAEKFDFPFDLLAKRIAYLIDREGTIARTYALVVPAEHPGRVLADLRELEG